MRQLLPQSFRMAALNSPEELWRLSERSSHPKSSLNYSADNTLEETNFSESIFFIHIMKLDQRAGYKKRLKVNKRCTHWPSLIPAQLGWKFPPTQGSIEQTPQILKGSPKSSKQELGLSAPQGIQTHPSPAPTSMFPRRLGFWGFPWVSAQGTLRSLSWLWRSISFFSFSREELPRPVAQAPKPRLGLGTESHKFETSSGISKPHSWEGSQAHLAVSGQFKQKPWSTECSPCQPKPEALPFSCL